VSELRNEILLRLAKVLAAGIVGAIIYAVAVLLLGVQASFEVAALCWLSGAAGILLAETSPI
jgi:hypothetical protein